MPASSRFTVAVHILSGLAISGDEPLTSEAIAHSVHTNPTVIRRLLVMLGQAGLSHSRLGQGGGSLLAKPAEDVTLLDVYRVVENQPLFSIHSVRNDSESGDCLVARHIGDTLQPAMGRAVLAFENELSKITIADIVADIRSRERISASLHRHERPIEKQRAVTA